MFEIFPTYRGMRIVVRKRNVFNELDEISLDLWDVKEILETGFDCSRSKRRKSIEEKCIRKGKKVIKVVVEKTQAEETEVWVLRHLGMFGWKKRRFKI